MRVLAVKTFLVAIDHGFPVEAAGVFDGFAIGEAAEVVLVEEVQEGGWEPRGEGGSGGGDGAEEETCGG